jgi:hypothetical protein
MWGIGMICGPMIGGLLANPIDTFPTLFGPILTPFLKTNPYFLPCFFSACISFTGLLIGFFFLEETLKSKGGYMPLPVDEGALDVKAPRSEVEEESGNDTEDDEESTSNSKRMDMNESENYDKCLNLSENGSNSEFVDLTSAHDDEDNENHPITDEIRVTIVEKPEPENIHIIRSIRRNTLAASKPKEPLTSPLPSIPRRLQITRVGSLGDEEIRESVVTIGRNSVTVVPDSRTSASLRNNEDEVIINSPSTHTDSAAINMRKGSSKSIVHSSKGKGTQDSEEDIIFGPASIKSIVAYGMLSFENIIFDETFSLWSVTPPADGNYISCSLK